MARAPLTSMDVDVVIPTVTFHRKTFGQNIELADNASKATRHTSFDNGITFTSKQIKPNERIYMKIIDVDETGQWLGSLAIGFTQIDPDSIQRQELCKSALPNLCQKSGTTYVKRIFEKLTREIIITFYYNQQGAFYILDGKEQDLCKSIDAKKPLWGVIDIYGNVKGVVFTTPPQVIDGSRLLFNKYNQKPDKLPIRYFTNLNSTNKLQFIGFNEKHGPELELFCQNMIAFRKNVQRLARPYLFINFPMTPGDELYIRVLSVDPNYRLPGIIGFTTAKPPVFNDNFDKLPSGDLMALYDRPEFWIVSDNAFDEKLAELDEYRIVFDKSGEFHMWRNNESKQPTRTVADGDSSQTFYPFFFLNGRITSLALMGIVTTTSITQTITNAPSSEKDSLDPNSGLCNLCMTEPANCVLLPCGHIFFCSDCKPGYESKFGKVCPMDRKVYENALEIASD